MTREPKSPEVTPQDGVPVPVVAAPPAPSPGVGAVEEATPTAVATPGPKAEDPASAVPASRPPGSGALQPAAAAGAPTTSDAVPPSGQNMNKSTLASAEPHANPADLDARIAALERQIAGDEESLKALLSEVPAPGAPDLADRPEFREIALRLPKEQAELRTLQDQRARHSEP